VEMFDEGAEALLAGTKEVFGFLALSDIANNNEGAAGAIEIDERGVHLPDAELAGLGAVVELDVANLTGFDQVSKDRRALVRIDPKIHFAGSFVEGFLAGIAGEASEAIVDFDVRAIGEGVDAEGVRAGAKCGGKHLLRAVEGFFGVEQVVRNAALLAIGEDKPRRGTNDGSGNSKPGEDQLFASNGAAHEDHEKGNDNGEDLGGDQVADGGR
jgi:hypothetical protein